MRSCIRPIFKTATEACSFSRPCSACIRFCKSSSPMADIKGRSFKRLWPKRFRTSKSKSSNGRITPKASRFSPSVGLSNAPSPGSTDAGDWPRTLKTSPAMPWHSCVSPRSASCSENFVINNQLSGPTLSLAKALGWNGEARLGFGFRWTGLSGRALNSWANPLVLVSGGYVAHDTTADTFVEIPLDTPLSALTPYVEQATKELFLLFDGYTLPSEVVEGWVRRLLERRL